MQSKFFQVCQFHGRWSSLTCIPKWIPYFASIQIYFLTSLAILQLKRRQDLIPVEIKNSMLQNLVGGSEFVLFHFDLSVDRSTREFCRANVRQLKNWVGLATGSAASSNFLVATLLSLSLSLCTAFNSVDVLRCWKHLKSSQFPSILVADYHFNQNCDVIASVQRYFLR